MATSVAEIVLQVPPTILGPESDYEKRRIALKADADRALVEARKVTVVDSPDSLETANNAGRVLQAEGKEVELFFKPVKSQIDALKKPVLAAEKELADSIDVEKRRLGGLITKYNQEIERQRQEEERKAREEAERQAREEALQRAVELESAGDREGAEAVLEEPIVAAPVVIQQAAPPKMAGQVGKTVYTCKVENVKELMKAVVEGKAPTSCFTLDQGWLNKKAALDKEGFNLPGCKLDKQSSTHFRV
jgi:hypothetical protein